MNALLEQPQSTFVPSNVDDIAAKVWNGERLSYEDGVRLMHHPNLAELGILADHVRQKQNPGRVVTYIAGRNINYSNVCWVQCKFCAFYDLPASQKGYVLSQEQIFTKIQEMVDLGGIEILIQGGLNPKLRIDYYEELFSSIKAKFPQVWIHGLSVAEVLYIAKISRLSLEETMRRLHASGLGTIPGAGAEMLVDRVRKIIAPYKDTTDEWLHAMQMWHKLGGHSSVTMMYGTVETPEERVEHMIRVRDVQDESLRTTTGSFTAFIAWNFQPDGTPLGDELRGLAYQTPHESQGVNYDPNWRKATGYDYLRTVAVGRLLLDNIPHHQASWVTQGPKIAQIGLNYGLDDFGSTMMEENVVSAAGTDFVMPISEIERLIEQAGYEPKRRSTLYEVFSEKSGY
ncbi:MAG: cyclic dehypoxanthinyl futalosine synthase [Abditibacteriota bacterium]|nr:cyclic dehypoxanthinyl futalosine synthase [Abditibacteriota bacterium]